MWELNFCCTVSIMKLTWFQVSKGDFSREQLPQTEGVAEHVCLHRVARALREDLRSHPAQVLHHTQEETRSARLQGEFLHLENEQKSF